MEDAIRSRARLDVAFRSSLTVWVPANPDQVFAYVSDITRHPEWAVHKVTVQPLDPAGPVRVGSRFTSSGRQGGRDWPSTLEVTIYERPRRFEFTATGGPIPSPAGNPHRHTFRFMPDGGGTRIVYERLNPIQRRVTVVLLPIIGRFAMRIRRKAMVNLVARLQGIAKDGA